LQNLDYAVSFDLVLSVGGYAVLGFMEFSWLRLLFCNEFGRFIAVT